MDTRSLEVIVAVLIVVILATIGIQGFGKYKRHANKVVCVANMRTIHQGLADHLTDKGYWPQPTVPFEEATEEKYSAWWITAIEPYGVDAETWICPEDKVDPKEERIGERSSYFPTPFDAGKWTPFRWNQPWLMERGDLHGKGAHLAMPRGEIITSQEM